MDKFKGLGVAMVTPFHEDGSIDFVSLKGITRHLIDGEVDYLVVMGTTGENPTISKKEQAQILNTVRLENDGQIPIVFGIGGNSTKNVLERFKTTDLSGVDGILSVSPYYNKPSQEGIYRHYKALSEEAPLPIIAYNVPGRTGSCLTAETTLRIARLSNIVLTKEASGSEELVQEILNNKPAHFEVTSGDDPLTLSFMKMGAIGVISVIGNAYPAETKKLINFIEAKDWENAEMQHQKLLPMVEAIFMDGNPGGVKYLMSKMGLCKNEFRLPVCEVSNETERTIDEAML